MRHKSGNIYVVEGSRVHIVMLTRHGDHGVLATTMDSGLNRALQHEATCVANHSDITEDEMNKIMAGKTYEYRGVFPTFRLDDQGEIYVPSD